jgi:hypothetical protein
MAKNWTKNTVLDLVGIFASPFTWAGRQPRSIVKWIVGPFAWAQAQSEPAKNPVHRRPQTAIAVGQWALRLGIVMLILWATAAGTWRALRVVAGPAPGGAADPIGGLFAAPGHLFLALMGAPFFAAGAFGAAVLILLAAAALGGALGFLFGVPRISQQSRGGTVPEDKARGQTSQPQQVPAKSVEETYFRVSPSLNDIADWLTKIIVGVGLVQAREIGAAFMAMVTFLLHSAGLDRFPAAGIVVPGCLIMGLIGGFIAGYLMTVLMIGEELAIAAYRLQDPRVQELEEEVKKKDEKLSEIQEQARIAESALQFRSLIDRLCDLQNDNLLFLQNNPSEEELKKRFKQFMPGIFSDDRSEILRFLGAGVDQNTKLRERLAFAKGNLILGKQKSALDAYWDLYTRGEIENYELAREGQAIAELLNDAEKAKIFGDLCAKLLKDPELRRSGPGIGDIGPRWRERDFELDRVDNALAANPPDYARANELLNSASKLLGSAFDSDGRFYLLCLRARAGDLPADKSTIPADAKKEILKLFKKAYEFLPYRYREIGGLTDVGQPFEWLSSDLDFERIRTEVEEKMRN